MAATAYIDPPDVPEGMTLDEYRRARTRTKAHARPRRSPRRLLPRRPRR